MSNKSVFKKGAKTIYSSIYNLWSDKKDTSSSDLDYMSDEDLYNDNNDILWVGTNVGVDVYVPSLERFFTVKIKDKFI